MSVTAFGDLFIFIRNGMSVKQDKSGDGLPITRIETISNGKVDPKRVGYAGLSIDDARTWLLKPGDILFSHINSVEHIGKCAVYEGEPHPLVHGMNLLCLRPEPARLDTGFCKWLIRSEDFRSRLANFINKAVNQASVSIGNLRTIKVRMPDIEEQRRIAAILDQAEALRAKRRQALAKLDTLTQSLFLEMFGDPTTNIKPFPIRAMGDLFDEPPCYGTMIPGTSKGKFLVLRVANIQAWEIDLSNRKYVDLPASVQGRHTVRDGDIILARAIASLDHLGKAIVVHPGTEHWAFDSHLMRLRLDKTRILPEYLTTLLQTEGGRTLFLAVTRRSAVQFNVNTKEIASLRIPVPAIKSQIEFAARVGAVASHRKRFLHAIEQDSHLCASLESEAFAGGL